MNASVPQPPEVEFQAVNGVYIRQMFFRRVGDIELGHSHQYDHTTVVAAGAVRIEVEGKVSDFQAPHLVYIRAGKFHKLTALEDATVCLCVHRLDGDLSMDNIVAPGSIPGGIGLQEASSQ